MSLPLGNHHSSSNSDGDDDSDSARTAHVSRVCVLGPVAAARAVLLGLCGFRAADAATAAVEAALTDAATDPGTADAAQEAPELSFCGADSLEEARVSVVLPCTTHRLRCVRVPTDPGTAVPLVAVHHATHRAHALVLAWPCTGAAECTLAERVTRVLAMRVPGVRVARDTPCVVAVVHEHGCACRDGTRGAVAVSVSSAVAHAQEGALVSVLGVAHVRAGWAAGDVHGARAWAGLREALAWCAEAAECRAADETRAAAACVRHAAEALVPAGVPPLRWLAARALRDVLQDAGTSAEEERRVRQCLPAVLHDHVLWL